MLLAQWYRPSDPDLEEALAEVGIADSVMYRAHAQRPLTPWQRWMNRVLAPGRVQRPTCGRQDLASHQPSPPKSRLDARSDTFRRGRLRGLAGRASLRHKVAS